MDFDTYIFEKIHPLDIVSCGYRVGSSPHERLMPINIYKLPNVYTRNNNLSIF